MARSGRLLNFIVKALNSNKYINLKWFDKKRGMFLLECPNGRNRHSSSEYRQIYEDWHDLKPRTVYNNDKRSRFINALKKQFKFCEEYSTKNKNVYQIPKEVETSGKNESNGNEYNSAQPIDLCSSNELILNSIVTTDCIQVCDSPKIYISVPESLVKGKDQVAFIVNFSQELNSVHVSPISPANENNLTTSIEPMSPISPGNENNLDITVGYQSEHCLKSPEVSSDILGNQGGGIGFLEKYSNLEKYCMPLEETTKITQGNKSIMSFPRENCVMENDIISEMHTSVPPGSSGGLKSPEVSSDMLGNRGGGIGFPEKYINLEKYCMSFEGITESTQENRSIMSFPPENHVMENAMVSEMHTSVLPGSSGGEMVLNVSEVPSPNLESNMDEIMDFESISFDETIFNDLPEPQNFDMDPENAISSVRRDCSNTVLSNVTVSKDNMIQQEPVVELPVSPLLSSPLPPDGAVRSDLIRENCSQDSLTNVQENISFPKIIGNEISAAVNAVIIANNHNGVLTSDSISQQISDTVPAHGRILNEISFSNRKYFIALLEG